MKIEQELREKYKNKALIIPNYLKNGFYSVEDFSGVDEMISYLNEVNSHEADLTQEGILFIKDLCGLENLAKFLFVRKWNDSEYESSDQILEWLKWWEVNARK